MTKKELQEFMKAKLAKTKVMDSAKTSTSASGPAVKNFTNGGRRVEPTRRDDLKGPKKAKKSVPVTPSTYKGKGDELSDESSEDDIAAANEKMRLNALKFAAVNQPSVPKKKKAGVRANSRSNEEHKTTVRNISKNIYKPCFNMPAKDPKPPQMMSAKTKKPDARKTAKEYSEAQR